MSSLITFRRLLLEYSNIGNGLSHIYQIVSYAANPTTAIEYELTIDLHTMDIDEAYTKIEYRISPNVTYTKEQMITAIDESLKMRLAVKDYLKHNKRKLNQCNISNLEKGITLPMGVDINKVEIDTLLPKDFFEINLTNLKQLSNPSDYIANLEIIGNISNKKIEHVHDYITTIVDLNYVDLFYLKQRIIEEINNISKSNPNLSDYIDHKFLHVHYEVLLSHPSVYVGSKSIIVLANKTHYEYLNKFIYDAVMDFADRSDPDYTELHHVIHRDGETIITS